MLRNISLVVALLFAVAPVVACGKNDGSANGTSADSAKPEVEHKDEHGDDHAEEQKVELTEAAFATARIETAPVSTLKSEDQAETLQVPGQVEIDPRRLAIVSPRVSGRIESLRFVEGDRVNAGATVGTVYSREILAAQTDVVQALRRSRSLAGSRDEAGASALLDAARRRLLLTGADSAEVAALNESYISTGTIALRAPINGSIIEAHALPGAVAEAGAPVFTIADLSVVDVVAEIPERALPDVHMEQRAEIGIAAFPDLRFEGHVERLREALNPETRTLRAVIHVVNGNRHLRPGMFATVRLRIAVRDIVNARAQATVLAVPESAVLSDGDKRFVFVETSARHFERREIRVAASPINSTSSSGSSRALVLVQDGLREGERVVSRGALILKSELAKASLSDVH